MLAFTTGAVVAGGDVYPPGYPSAVAAGPRLIAEITTN